MHTPKHKRIICKVSACTPENVAIISMSSTIRQHAASSNQKLCWVEIPHLLLTSSVRSTEPMCFYCVNGGVVVVLQPSRHNSGGCANRSVDSRAKAAAPVCLWSSSGQPLSLRKTGRMSHGAPVTLASHTFSHETCSVYANLCANFPHDRGDRMTARW